MPDRDTAARQDIAQIQEPGRVPRHLFMRRGRRRAAHAAKVQRLARIDQDQPVLRDAPLQRLCAFGARSQNAGLRVGRQKRRDRAGVHVVGMAMGAKQPVDSGKRVRRDGRRHHSGMGEGLAPVLLCQRIRQVGIYHDAQSALRDQEARLPKPPDGRTAIRAQGGGVVQRLGLQDSHLASSTFRRFSTATRVARSTLSSVKPPAWGVWITRGCARRADGSGGSVRKTSVASPPT